MILELFIVSIVLASILLFFYRQAIQEFRILQTESLEKAIGLLYERCPIVVIPFPEPPKIWTRADIDQRPSLKKLTIQGVSLENALKYESFPMTPALGESVATQVGFPVWVKNSILPHFRQSAWWSSILWPRTEVLIGAHGLRQTYAYCSIIVATEGALSVSLLNESSDSYLPTKWLGKRLTKLSKDDAPLLHQIQYIDVIVRPGSALLIPPHWKVCWETYKEQKSALALWIELHHPVSYLVHSASFRQLK